MDEAYSEYSGSEAGYEYDYPPNESRSISPSINRVPARMRQMLKRTFKGDIVFKRPDCAEGGMSAAIKELYRERLEAGYTRWSIHKIVGDAEDSSDRKNHALIVRWEKDSVIGTALMLHSITVQSPLIKEFLDKVFLGFKGISTKLNDLTFSRPFHEFFYRWETFQHCVNMIPADDTEAFQHVRLLERMISAEVQPHLDKSEDLKKNNLITFQYLWTLFEPGSEAYAQIDGQDRLLRVVHSEEGKGGASHIVSCRYIDYDGSRFGAASTQLCIHSFKGVKSVSELPVIPARQHNGIEKVLQGLIKRGKKFQDLRGTKYKFYSGLHFGNSRFPGEVSKQHVEGRIMIDCKLWNTYNADKALRLEPLDALDSQLSHSQLSQAYNGYDSVVEIVPDAFDELAGSHLPPPPPPGRMTRPPGFIPPPPGPYRPRRAPEASQSTDDNAMLTREQLALCTPMLRGYCLSTKKWVRFFVDNVREIEWNAQAFQSLVLPHDYKEIVLAFVQSQLTHQDHFDDVIQGKGRGFIMLLSGDPGVGKTLTAESVAEEMKLPLYAMSAGELGTTAEEVEGSLRKTLEICTKWEAVFLLDECDVFLETRSLKDIKRNKLVSVFLRLLEYYRGVMFLTTNRALTLDPAFQSRVHLSINYPNLDFTSRKMIWQTFIQPRDSSQKQLVSSIDEEELNLLAQLDLNGREIKNIVKTARLLAIRNEAPLETEHVQTVLRVKQRSAAMLKRSQYGHLSILEWVKVLWLWLLGLHAWEYLGSTTPSAGVGKQGAQLMDRSDSEGEM